MIGVTDARKGTTIELDGQLYRVVEYQHIKVARGSATVRLKLHDLKGNHTIERTFQAGDKLTPARLETLSAQYMYRDDNLFYFMDNETYDQFSLDEQQLEGCVEYLKEGMNIDVTSYQEKPIGVQLPVTVELEVTETGPAFKGDTATGGTKPATMETGLIVQVPMFVNTGEILKIDTRSGTYIERAG
jgi:elongation factor P